MKHNFTFPKASPLLLMCSALLLLLGSSSLSHSQAGTFEGKYYDTQDFGDYKLTRNNSTINFNWGSTGPQNNSSLPGYMNPTTYSIRWTGWVDCPTTGTYTFESVSDDGVRLFIDGSPVINAWWNRSATDPAATGSVYLVQGAHRLTFEYYQGPAPDASVDLRWRVPGNTTTGQLPLVPAADTPLKMWTANPQWTGGGWVSPQGIGTTFAHNNANRFYMDENVALDYVAGEVFDTDSWSQGAIETGTAPGTIVHTPTAFSTSNGNENAGTFPIPSRIGRYLSPNLQEGQLYRDIQIRVSATDTDVIGAGEGGYRKDGSGQYATISYPDIYIRVRQKVWTTAGPIGVAPNPDTGGFDLQDGATANGRLTSPVDTRGGTQKPAYAAPGAIIPCQVEEATDYDSYTYYPGGATVSTPLPDSSYVWTATNGQFRVFNAATNSYSLVSSVTGRTASFVAPAAANGQAASATITCKISDPITSVPAPESGNRTDAPLIRTQQIIVPANFANVGLYKADDPQTSDPTRPQQTYSDIENDTPIIGGTSFIGVYVKTGLGMRVGNATMKLSLQELPSNGITHTSAEDHVDFNVVLNNAAGWQRFYDPDGTGPKQIGWWPAPYSPGHPANITANQVAEYRYLIPWNSNVRTNSSILVNGTPESFLWGHNGPHRLTAVTDNVPMGSISFTSNYGGSYLAAAGQQNKLVSNTTITDVVTNNGTSDYFKFSRESTDPTIAHPTISFRIVDEGDPHGYSWAVRIRGTNEDQDPEGILIKGAINTPGTVTVKINDPLAAGQTQQGYNSASPNGNGIYTEITDYGTYTFDFSVLEQDGWGNHLDNFQGYRSTKTFIPYYFTDTNGQTVRGHSGKIVKDANGVENYYVTYYLKDTSAPANSAATNFNVKLLAPGMTTTTASSDGSWVKTLNTPVKDKLLHTFTTPREAGMYITPFTGVDNHAAEYRDHKNRSILAKNDRVNETPTLFNDTRSGDRVVSSSEGGLPGGDKVLHIQIWPPQATITIGLRKTAGLTGSATLKNVDIDGNPIAQIPYVNSINLKGKIGGNGEPIKQEITIHGGATSDVGRNYELFIKNQQGVETQFTLDGAQTSGWKFTIFRVESEIFLGNTPTMNTFDATLPKNAKNILGQSLYDMWSSMVQDSLGYKPSPIKLGFNSYSSPGGRYFQYGGMVLRGKLLPKTLPISDLNNKANRSLGFMLYQYVDTRNYSETGKPRVLSSEFATYAHVDNYEDMSNTTDSDLSFEQDITNDDNFYIWHLDAPYNLEGAFSTYNIPTNGNIIRRRNNFRDYFSYADVRCSNQIDWNFCASMIYNEDTAGNVSVNQIDDIKDGNGQNIDNKVSIGSVKLTPNLSNSPAPTFSVISRKVNTDDTKPIVTRSEAYINNAPQIFTGSFDVTGLTSINKSDCQAYLYFSQKDDINTINHVIPISINDIVNGKLLFSFSFAEYKPTSTSSQPIAHSVPPGNYTFHLCVYDKGASPPHQVEITTPLVFKDEVLFTL